MIYRLPRKWQPKSPFVPIIENRVDVDSDDDISINDISDDDDDQPPDGHEDQNNTSEDADATADDSGLGHDRNDNQNPDTKDALDDLHLSDSDENEDPVHGPSSGNQGYENPANDLPPSYK